jgi:hypothetical protein
MLLYKIMQQWSIRRLIQRSSVAKLKRLTVKLQPVDEEKEEGQVSIPTCQRTKHIEQL